MIKLITVGADVFVDVFGVDNAAVTKRNAGLHFHKVAVVQRFYGFGGLVIFVQKSFDKTTLRKVFFNDFFDVVDLDFAVKRALGINDANGAHRAKTEASRLNDLHVVFKVCIFDLTLELCDKICAVVGGTARTAAN